MTTIKVFEIEMETKGWGENVENAVNENEYFGTREKAEAKLKEIYDELFIDDEEDDLPELEGDFPKFELPKLEKDTFTVRGYDFIRTYTVVEKEIKIF